MAAPLPVPASTYQASAHDAAHAFTHASTHLHSNMLPTSQEGQLFNPAVAEFEPSGAADLRRERANADALLKLVQQQASAITSLYGDLENVTTSLQFAVEDINDVATAMKGGPAGTSTTSVKKLTYRAADIEGVMRKQGQWKRTLQESMLRTDAGLKEIGAA